MIDIPVKTSIHQKIQYYQDFIGFELGKSPSLV